MAGQASHHHEISARETLAFGDRPIIIKQVTKIFPLIESDGRILQKAGEREIILTEIIDLDDVTKSREYGSLSLCQLWKQLRDYPQDFPIYKNGIATHFGDRP